MSTPIIERLGSFENVVEASIKIIKEQIDPNLDEEDYRQWMLRQKEYSPTYYSKGLFFDFKLYHYCYKVTKKMSGDNNQQHLILIAGKVGKGKSSLASQIACLIDPTFNMTRVCYVPPHLFTRLEKCNPFEANIIDEGGNFFKSRNAMSKLGKAISQAFQLIREFKQVLIICYDEPEKLDKDIIDKIDGIFVKVVNNFEKGDKMFREYEAYKSKACDKIKPLLKEKKPITDAKIRKHRSWYGRNIKEMPELNDFNEKIYREEKTKYLRMHMKKFAKEFKEEYEDIKYKEDKEEIKPIQDLKAIKVSQYCKNMNISRTTADKLIRENKINHIRINGMIRIINNGEFDDIARNN